jgi:hypothetical protein
MSRSGAGHVDVIVERAGDDLARGADYSLSDVPAAGLFLAEAIQPDHLGAFARLAGRVLIFDSRFGNR